MLRRPCHELTRLWKLPLTVLLALHLAGCTASEVQTADAPKNLLLIVSDTLRADALECYGGLSEVPAICDLARRGVLFERAYSNGPWTLPSAVTMFTGNYASTYSRYRLGTLGKLEKEGFFYIPDDEKLLAEALGEKGYVSTHFLETTVANQPNTFQGFEAGEDSWEDSMEVVKPIFPDIRQRLEGLRSKSILGAMRFLLTNQESPFFLVLWIHDPHAAYAPHERFRGDLESELTSLPQPPQHYLGLGHLDRPAEGLVKMDPLDPGLSAEEVEMLHKLYHREVETVDRRVALVMEALEKGGHADDTLVLFTSDHGEGFGEHGFFLHGNQFYDELVHIPLIVAGPGVEPGHRVPTPVSHLDLMPTLFELLGVEGLNEPAGRSYAPMLRGEEAEVERSHYLVSPLKNRRGDALVEGRHKLIVEKGELYLYDLLADPGEQRDLSAEEPERVGAMRRALVQIRQENERRRAENLASRDDEAIRRTGDATLKELKALGYID